MHPRILPALVVTGSLALAACGGDEAVRTVGAESHDPQSTVAPRDDVDLDWEECGEDLECATLVVPLDYAEPDAGTIELPLVRHLAGNSADRIGSLLVNPGGPGFGGTILAEYAANIYSQAILDHFDVVGWDPRGTGESEPAIDCIDDYDDYFAVGDITPDTDAEHDELVEQSKRFAEACEERNGELLAHVGTNNSARDMDEIRQALGEDEISYFGFSYGSELGGTWATMFPDTVRAAVLDGAADPNADSTEGLAQQLAGFEGTLATFLAECSADRSCEFYNDGDAEGAYDDLMAELDEQPIPTEAGRPDLTRGMANVAVAQAMYDESLWTQLAGGLAEAQAGEGATLLGLFDAYYQRTFSGDYGNEIEAFMSILCVDSDERPTMEEADAEVPRLQEAAPRFSPGTTGDYTCTFWQAPADPRIEITGVGAGPIVVIGTTGDPATPLDSTRRMAEALEDGRLVIVTADQHTGYNVNDCVNDVVDDYLIDLEAPEHETQCR